LRLTAKALEQQEADRMLDELEQHVLAEVGMYFYGYGETSLPEVVLKRYQEAGLTLSLAESLTGGAVASGLVDVSGASQVLRGSAVVYDDAAKQGVLSVPEVLLREHTAVSKEVAIAMAEGVRELYQSDIAVALTGEAGPTSNSGKVVGTVYCAVADAHGTRIVEWQYPSFDRGMIRLRAVKDTYFLLLKHLEKASE